MAVNLKIDGIDVCAEDNVSILEAAASAGIQIPSLCFMKNCNSSASCRICVVQVKGMSRFVAACTWPVSEGLEVMTDSPELRRSRRHTLELMCENHRMDCEYCSRYTDCEFHALLREYEIDDRVYSRLYRANETDTRDNGLVYDRSKCILCRRCVGACHEQGIDLLQVFERSNKAKIGVSEAIGTAACIHCGQCISVCPTGALSDYEQTDRILHVLEDRTKYMVAAVAPEASAMLGEYFAEERGTDVSGKIAAVLRKLGFRRVVNAEDGRKLAVKNLAEEITERAAASRLPLLTANCPAWVKSCENRPAFSAILSCSAPPFRLLKAACLEQFGEDAQGKEVCVVSISACLAEKLDESGSDIHITVRELASLIKRGCVSRYTAMQVWRTAEDSPFDPLNCVPKGMESIPSDASLLVPALRYAGAVSEGGGTYRLGGRRIQTAAVTGISNAERALESGADVISVMACPGGCINGGGRAQVDSHTGSFENCTQRRMLAIGRRKETCGGIS